MFSESMDSFFWLFINPEQFFAHLFDTSHGCWAGVLVVMTLLFAIIVVIQFKLQIRSSFIFAYTIVIIKMIAYTVVMLADVISSQEVGIVIVMLLLFTVTIVITYMFPLHSARGCTNGEVFARMFVLGT